jgi:hypothetical protein
VEAKAKSVSDGLIEKPQGRRSRDYNTFEEMASKREAGLDKETYNNLIASPSVILYINCTDF